MYIIMETSRDIIETSRCQLFSRGFFEKINAFCFENASNSDRNGEKTQKIQIFKNLMQFWSIFRKTWRLRLLLFLRKLENYRNLKISTFCQ